MDLYRTARETALLAALRVAIALLAMIGRELKMSEVERRSIVGRVEQALLDPTAEAGASDRVQPRARTGIAIMVNR